MRKFLFFILYCFFYVFSYSQIDTEFWFAAPEVSVSYDNFDKPIFLHISTYNKPATVTISQPANPSFNPIVVDIQENSFKTVDLTPYLDIIELKPADKILNYGLHIVATSEISIYYEVASTYCNCNPELFTLKGKNALGTEFYISSQTEFKNGPYSPTPYSSFNIVATEDNTEVTIIPSRDIVNHKAGVPFTITLNKGQCYSGWATSQDASGHLAGTKVTSNKPIAITIADDLVNPGYGGCWDLMGDQTVPISLLGNEYIAVRGFLSSGNDRLYILAVQDATEVYINGNFINKIDAGQTLPYTFGSNDALYVKTDKPVYVLHISGNGCEIGQAILPSIHCTGSKQVQFTRSSSMEFYLLIATQDGFKDAFELNGSTTHIKPTDFNYVPGTNNKWVFAKLQFDEKEIPVNKASKLLNTKGVFHLGILNGNAGGGCRYGYFSAFNKFSTSILAYTTKEPEIYAEAFCFGDTTQFKLKDTIENLTVTWNFDDPGSGTNNTSNLKNPKHYYAKPGIYKVSAIYTYECGKDTAYLELKINENPVLNLGADIKTCNDSYVIKPNVKDVSYLWSDGSTADTLFVDKSGLYILTITNSNGCVMIDSIEVQLATNPEVRLGKDTTICWGATLTLDAGNGFDSYKWSDGITVSQQIKINSPGEYSVTVTNNEGCTAADTIKIDFFNIKYSLGNDLQGCQGTPINIDAGANYVDYKWSNGANQQVISVTQTGKYTVTVTDANSCTASDDIQVNFKQSPVVNLGNDTVICKGSGKRITLNIPGATYLWNDGSKSNTNYLTTEGLHWVEVTTDCGKIYDSIRISYVPEPIFSFGNDTILCLGESLYLSVELPYSSYLWDDGSKLNYKEITQQGQYWLEATNTCNDKHRDTIYVEFQNCDCYIFFPTAFTPNNDGKNDFFTPVSNCEVLKFYMAIYDRWGTMIFETYDINKYWDGKFRGKLVEGGVYPYIVQYKISNETTLKKINGNILLIR